MSAVVAAKLAQWRSATRRRRASIAIACAALPALGAVALGARLGGMRFALAVAGRFALTMPTMAPAAFAMISDDRRLMPDMSTIEGIIMMSLTPT